MNAANQALSVYQKAYDRFNNGTSKLVDDVVVALWNEVQDMAETIREQNLKISMLEARGNGPDESALAEYTKVMAGMSWYKPPVAVDTSKSVNTTV